MSANIGLVLAGIFYLVAAAFTAQALFKGKTLNQNALLSGAVIAIVCQLLTVQTVMFAADGIHLSFIAMSLLINVLIVAVLTIRSMKHVNLMILLVTYIFSALLSLGLLLVPHDSFAYIGTAIHTSVSLFTHIVLSLSAYCVLVIASLYAVQFRYIDAKLKAKTLSLHSHLPPLNVVETQHFRLLTVGLVLLSLALLTGFTFLDNMWSKEFAHKTVLSLAAWVIFAILAVGHKRYGWRGTNSAIATIVASILLTLAYFGSRFVREILLN